MIGCYLYFGDIFYKTWKEGVKDDWKIFGLSNWKDVVVMNWGEDDSVWKGFGREISSLDLGMWNLKWNFNNLSERLWSIGLDSDKRDV